MPRELLPYFWVMPIPMFFVVIIHCIKIATRGDNNNRIEYSLFLCVHLYIKKPTQHTNFLSLITKYFISSWVYHLRASFNCLTFLGVNSSFCIDDRGLGIRCGFVCIALIIQGYPQIPFQKVKRVEERQNGLYCQNLFCCTLCRSDCVHFPIIPKPILQCL